MDVSHLKINDYIRVKNIQADAKVKILTDPEIVVVTIVPPIKEEVPVEAAAEAAEPEVVKKGKTGRGRRGGRNEIQSSKVGNQIIALWSAGFQCFGAGCCKLGELKRELWPKLLSGSEIPANNTHGTGTTLASWFWMRLPGNQAVAGPSGCFPGFAGIEIGGFPVLLAEPLTYMNHSGKAVHDLLSAFQRGPQDLLLVVDDLNLPFGRIRIRERGSAGGHHGLESILDRFKHR